MFACLGGPLWEGRHGPLVGGLGVFHVMGLPSKQAMLPMLGTPHTASICHWRPSGAMEEDRCIVCMLGGASLGGQTWPTSGGTWYLSCHGPPKQAPHAPHAWSSSKSLTISMEALWYNGGGWMHCLHAWGGLFGRVGMAHYCGDMDCFMSWASQASKPFSPCMDFLTQS